MLPRLMVRSAKDYLEAAISYSVIVCWGSIAPVTLATAFGVYPVRICLSGTAFQKPRCIGRSLDMFLVDLQLWKHEATLTLQSRSLQSLDASNSMFRTAC